MYDDWDPDFDILPEDEMLPEEEYTGRPVPFSNKFAGDTHHQDCTQEQGAPLFCCKALWERDYLRKQEEELEEMHQEWWQ